MKGSVIAVSVLTAAKVVADAASAIDNAGGSPIKVKNNTPIAWMCGNVSTNREWIKQAERDSRDYMQVLLLHFTNSLSDLHRLNDTEYEEKSATRGVNVNGL